MKKLMLFKLPVVLFLLTLSFFSCGKNKEEIISEYKKEKEEDIAKNNWYLVKSEVDSSKLKDSIDILEEVRFNYESSSSFFIFRSGSIKKGLLYRKIRDLMVYESYLVKQNLEVDPEKEVKIIFAISGDTLKYGTKYGKFYYLRKNQ